jgi:hypothetical protein
MPPQRRRPDMDETRQALRRHDERVEDDPTEPAEDPKPAESDDEEQPDE